jgi:hypothetical protein
MSERQIITRRPKTWREQFHLVLPSALADGLTKDVSVQSIVVPELEFSNVQRQIFAADLVEVAHDTALDERPEAFDCVRMNRAYNVLPLIVIDRFYAGTGASADHSRYRRQCKAG